MEQVRSYRRLGPDLNADERKRHELICRRLGELALNSEKRQLVDRFLKSFELQRILSNRRFYLSTPSRFDDGVSLEADLIARRFFDTIAYMVLLDKLPPEKNLASPGETYALYKIILGHTPYAAYAVPEGLISETSKKGQRIVGLASYVLNECDEWIEPVSTRFPGQLNWWRQQLPIRLRSGIFPFESRENPMISISSNAAPVCVIGPQVSGGAETEYYRSPISLDLSKEVGAAIAGVLSQ